MKKLLRVGTYLRLLPLIPQLPNFVRLGWRLLRDSRVPVVLKSMVVLAFLYSISPFDVIPDFFFPGVGYVDDATLLLLMGYYFIRWSPQEVVTEHVTAIGGSFQRTFQRWRPRVDLRSSRISSLL
ncbi:MAG TPA: YkvA family protein [Candidatus Tectomicrobia bacterium]|jgi:uncharacterized membrane protein YkvA (DUF1232 family)|nr:YkvA family protein [Candidatus Tectomicrobia bacterium]